MADRILLFSGGLDSLMLKHLYSFEDRECLFVRLGTQENVQEEKFIDSYAFTGIKKVDLPLCQFELGNKILPFRNHMLAIIGAQYSNQIYFAFTAGDTTKDKDYVFKAQMEGLFNYFALDVDKVHHPGQHEVFMPFKHKSKGQLIKKYIDQFGLYATKNLLADSKSCYAGTDHGCGVCRSCLRKYVAACYADAQLGVFVRDMMDADPRKDLTDFYAQSIIKGRAPQELKEIAECIKQQ